MTLYLHIWYSASPLPYIVRFEGRSHGSEFRSWDENLFLKIWMQTDRQPFNGLFFRTAWVSQH